MEILKFGGTSVANAQNIEKVLQIIQSNSHKKIIVVSALGGVTDSLDQAIHKAIKKDATYLEIITNLQQRHLDTLVDLKLQNPEVAQNYIQESFKHLKTLLEGTYLLGELSNKAKDAIFSYGELLSSVIIYQKCKDLSLNVAYKDSRELIKTNSNFGNAQVNFDTTNYFIQYFFDKNQAHITLLPGFIAQDSLGNTTTLGRGGSDYTAAIIAAALEVKQLEIWTDVSGMYTANPKLVKQAFPIPSISYKEAMELSHFGAKVLYAPTIQPVLSKDIPIVIKNTFAPNDAGTIISDALQNNDLPIKGISHIEKVALITLEGSGLVGITGSSKRLFGAIAKQNINIMFITQASSEHSICIGVMEEEVNNAKNAIDQEFQLEISQFKIKPSIIEDQLSIIAIVGENMKSHQGLSGKMFSTLGNNNVNIRAIAQGASERNISAVIARKDVKKALNCLHERFFEENKKQLNLFVMGAGNVGEKFLEQIHQQKEYLRQNLKIDVRIVAIANSKKMLFNAEGINLENWKDQLTQSQDCVTETFVAKVLELNLRNSIFVDNTANAAIAALYAPFLKQNIAVVTCNKIASSSRYENYQNLKDLSRKYNTPFLFETNVGAGLPIIDTLKNLIASGDRVHKIQAVLSGSLNFIFNNFTLQNSFHDTVKEAGVQGFTEPDPKIDLSGVDVARKILILIRESGFAMEMEAIANHSFLPEACLATTSNEAFFACLQEHASHFEDLYKQANAKDCKLKYVAQFENAKATVGLQEVPKDSPFYNLEGKDNIVLFYTDRYAEQPLLIKGAGAGAAVTASGLFADIIRIGNN